MSFCLYLPVTQLRSQIATAVNAEDSMKDGDYSVPLCQLTFPTPVKFHPFVLKTNRANLEVTIPAWLYVLTTHLGSKLVHALLWVNMNSSQSWQEMSEHEVW